MAATNLTDERVCETGAISETNPLVFGPGTAQKLEALNPMIVGNEWNDDTAHNIRCALEFLADAVPSVIDSGASKEISHGVHVLLRTCAAALEVCHD